MAGVDYNELNTWLDSKDVQRLADEAGITRRQMWNRLNAKVKKFSLIEPAIKVALENKIRITSQLERLKSLSASI